LFFEPGWRQIILQEVSPCFFFVSLGPLPVLSHLRCLSLFKPQSYILNSQEEPYNLIPIYYHSYKRRMSQFEDKLLIGFFLLTRSETAFRQLYCKHSQYLYRLALQFTGRDHSAAGDIIQETWIRAIENLGRFKGISSFKTWISGILINCCREHNRKKLKLESIGQNQAVASNTINDNSDLRLDINQALSGLPEGYKEILILHDMEGFKHGEIGKLLGISAGTSKSQLYHARKAMKELLK
jgi:RNA polymerase sigma factor (sigma-70 family)